MAPFPQAAIRARVQGLRLQRPGARLGKGVAGRNGKETQTKFIGPEPAISARIELVAQLMNKLVSTPLCLAFALLASPASAQTFTMIKSFGNPAEVTGQY